MEGCQGGGLVYTEPGVYIETSDVELKENGSLPRRAREKVSAEERRITGGGGGGQVGRW